MTLQTLGPHIEDGLAKKTAGSVLDKVFAEIKTLAQVSEHSEQWAQNGLNILRFSNDIEIGFAHSKAAMLAIFKDAWDSLPLSFRKQYGYQFIRFAKIWTGGKGTSTISNYIATAKIWVLDEYGFGKQIEIKERSVDGSPIIENGRQATKQVTFYPYNVSLSKLGILNVRALKDDMTDTLWEMLVDDFYTCDDVRAEHHKDNGDGKGHQYTLKYGLLGPALVVYQNQECVVVAEELNWAEYETDPLVKDAIDTVIRILNIEMDEDKIHKIEKEKHK
jgi:hypothetical protein